MVRGVKPEHCPSRTRRGDRGKFLVFLGQYCLPHCSKNVGNKGKYRRQTDCGLGRTRGLTDASYMFHWVILIQDRTGPRSGSDSTGPAGKFLGRKKACDGVNNTGSEGQFLTRGEIIGFLRQPGHNVDVFHSAFPSYGPTNIGKLSIHPVSGNRSPLCSVGPLSRVPAAPEKCYTRSWIPQRT